MKHAISLLTMSFGCAFAWAQSPIVLKTELQDNPPKFILDKEKKASGICIDIFRMLETKENIKFTFPPVYVPAKAIETNIGTGAADVHCGWIKNDKRLTIASFGEPLLTVSYPVVVRANDKTNFSSISDLINLEDLGIVIGVNGVGSTNAMLRAGLRVNDSAKDAEDALKMLETGRGRAFIYTNLAIDYELQQPKNKNKFKLVKLDYQGNKSFDTQPQYLVFSKKVPEDTVKRVNAAVAKQRGEIGAILKKYGGSP